MESESNSNNTDFEEFGDNESINPEYDRLEKVRNFLRFQTENDNSENEIESPNENDTPSELNTIKQTCRCGQQCFSKFQESDILNHVFNVKEMEKNVKDIYILWVLIVLLDLPPHGMEYGAAIHTITVLKCKNLQISFSELV